MHGPSLVCFDEARELEEGADGEAGAKSSRHKKAGVRRLWQAPELCRCCLSSRRTSLPASRPEQGTFLTGGVEVSRQSVPQSWGAGEGCAERMGRGGRTSPDPCLSSSPVSLLPRDLTSTPEIERPQP